MSSDNTAPPNVPLSTWAYAFIALYAVVGYFAGNEHSALAGAALTTVGLATGWWVSRKLTAANPVAKGLALVAPLGILLLTALLLRTPPAAGKWVLPREFTGTWASQGVAKELTVRVEGDSAWLSQATGLQNVPFHAKFQHDSLVLRADEADPLVFRVAMDTTRQVLVLVSDGVNFLRVQAQ